MAIWGGDSEVRPPLYCDGTGLLYIYDFTHWIPYFCPYLYHLRNNMGVGVGVNVP